MNKSQDYNSTEKNSTLQLFTELTCQGSKNYNERKEKMSTKKTDEIVLKEIKVEHAIITIEGKGDLVLNKMNASNTRQLVADDRKAQALWESQHKNKWEDIITSIHWRDGIPVEDTNAECTEELFYKMLEENAPCLSAFGLKKSWGQAVVRQEIDKYSTKFDSAVNIVADGGLIPIKFAEWKLDERLMSPKRGAPITTRLNHFIGWSAEIPVEFTTNVYSSTEIATIVNYAGFSLGIGSGRSSGYGRYHIADIK